MAQNILYQTQSAVLLLVPYPDTLRWVFIAVALSDGTRAWQFGQRQTIDDLLRQRVRGTVASKPKA